MTTIDSLTDAASAADIRELPIPPYRSATLPAIDYDAHPAYGGFLPKPTLRERIHAMNVFLRTFGFVTLRRIVDYENMPLLTKETGFKGLNFSTALRFMSMYATIRASRLLRTLTGQRRPAVPANPALLNKLKSDGIVCLSLKPDEIDAIRAATAACVCQARRTSRQHSAGEAQVRRQCLLVHAFRGPAGLRGGREGLRPL